MEVLPWGGAREREVTLPRLRDLTCKIGSSVYGGAIKVLGEEEWRKASKPPGDRESGLPGQLSLFIVLVVIIFVWVTVCCEHLKRTQ